MVFMGSMNVNATEIVTRSIQLLIPPQELPILGIDQPVII
jgi:hypothetical protein